MKKQSLQFSSRNVIAALVLSLGLAGAAFAQPPADAGGPRPGMHGHSMFHGKALQKLHDTLKLDAKQEALWQEAEQFAKSRFDGKREQFRAHREEIDALLGQSGVDLRAVLKRMDEFRAGGEKERDAVRERWLAVYDALDAGQKEQVRLFLKSGAERMQRAMMHRSEHGLRKAMPLPPAEAKP